MMNYFGTFLTQEPLLNKELDPNTKSTNRLLIVHFDQDDVLKALSILDMKISIGIDELRPQNLRQIVQYNAALITVIFNMPLDQARGKTKEVLDNGKLEYIVYIEFSKAFDEVPETCPVMESNSIIPETARTDSSISSSRKGPLVLPENVSHTSNNGQKSNTTLIDAVYFSDVLSTNGILKRSDGNVSQEPNSNDLISTDADPHHPVSSSGLSTQCGKYALNRVTLTVTWQQFIFVSHTVSLLYTLIGLKAQIITGEQLTDSFEVKTGVRQRYLLSPFLFLMVIDWITRTSTSEGKHGTQWTSRMQLDDLDFAHDMDRLSQTQQQMQEKTSVTAVSAAVDLNIHKKKSEVLRYNTACTNQITIEDLEDERTFTYLGSIIEEHGGSDADVKARIRKARAAYLQLENTWNSKQLATNTKARIFNKNIKTALLCRVEFWRTTKTIIQKIQVFITSRLRKILQIRRSDTVSNNLLWERTNQILVEEEIMKKRCWFCYAEADFHDHGVINTRAQFLAVVEALPREFNRYVTLSMFTSGVSEPYEILKRSILKRGDLTDRQWLDQLFNNIDLQHGSATDMLQRMGEVIGLITFDEGLFKQLFLSKLPQQVQAVLVSFQNNALDELAASADRTLEITKSSTTEVVSAKEKPQTTQNDITELCHTLTYYFYFRNDRNRSHSPRRSIPRKRSASRPRETDNPDWHWYHNQYGKSSRNCRKPCNFPNMKMTDSKNNSGNFQAGTR
ncbi:unnamed protein product [Schistosoma margrebowiei]|uniref:DUF6451 domain-containing protein n=1 Tax=Schistosoma margrebowiei TaxID=48269 RepID=A0A183N5N7_9TREM|nr:unnamed protein product [Schistosoma margrebowiei]